MSSTRPSRKRGRTCAEVAEPAHDQHIDGVSPGNAGSEKALDVWNSFREEYNESVEQLPLSLYRGFTLLNELDAQAHVLKSELVPTIGEYIKERRSVTRRQTRNMSGGNAGCNDDLRAQSRESTEEIGLEERDPRFAFAPGGVEHQFEKTAIRLVRISALSSELLRASEEKVNLAQATYDNVDRHVRLLDQAIKEHESCIVGSYYPVSSLPPAEGRIRSSSAASLRGTMRSRIPDRAGQVVLYSLSEESHRLHLDKRIQRPPSAVVEPEYTPPISSLRRHPVGPQKGVVPGNSADSTSNRPTVNTTRESFAALPGGDMPIDPHEPRYCYCNQVSWGEMIACDADDCDREWFHLGCAGLTEAPKGKSKWYCKACREGVLAGTRKRGH
ncbi:hypothetical protein M0805_003847 [Coniferiporia weirii]|nr:hypothetical protein M0805_003847 [Coniferiporia weirii]